MTTSPIFPPFVGVTLQTNPVTGAIEQVVQTSNGPDLTLYAKKTDLPPLGSTVNPVGSPAAGTSNAYAPVDHQHNFGPALQRKRVAAAASTSWVFDTAFPVGTVPIIGCLIECSDTTVNFAEPKIISIDNTQVTIALKAQGNTLSILTFGSITLFGGTVPTGTYLHLSARNPNV